MFVTFLMCNNKLQFFYLGLLCGLAIYNFTIINLPFPLALYKKLLGDPVDLSDLKELSPALTKYEIFIFNDCNVLFFIDYEYVILITKYGIAWWFKKIK